MLEGTHQIDSQLSIAERKQQLVLACMADRLAWVQACEPAPQPPLAKAGRLLQFIEPLIGLLPGRLGRWIRNAHFAGSLLPTVGKYLLKSLAAGSDQSAPTAPVEPRAKSEIPRRRAPAARAETSPPRGSLRGA